MSEHNLNDLPKTFDPKEVEKNWYATWENGGYFKPKAGKANKSHCIIMPPPNVTGRLHMGHALDVVTQDVPTRFKRMKGYETLWLPGMDHAGIATQSKVEALLQEKEGKTKHDFTREEFLEKIWEWKHEYGGIINKQQRSLGASCDWDYLMFTMDEGPNKAVKKVFVDWYNEGLIYQSEYIVNWDPKLQSAISDAEVVHKEIKGHFYHLLYQVKDSDLKLEVATTRPETLLGDTAIAVNPNDERFKHLVGKTAIVPLCNREVPIVGDEHVDMEKGTGCLKVTPGHDFNDFEIGKRHQLDIIDILNNDGTLNKYGLEWEGLDCKRARKAIVKKLKELEICIDVKDHIHPVGHGERSGVVIEPKVSLQWFVNTQEMSKVAFDAVKDETTKFIPKGWENTYFSWLKEPRDWCISRQLVWGHQIPIFYCDDCNHTWASEDKESSCTKCSSENVRQDQDVLDTWFSSGLWPLSTLGWPDPEKMKERNFDTFFPTTTLVTGFDIIFFWVVRMMFMTLKNVNKVPFENVYIHAIVRDKQGRKMSKSLGNGIEPLEMVDQYGADALRFTLASGSGYNRNINLDPARIEGYRNFINKIWNAFRFIGPFLENADGLLEEKSKLHTHDKWILAELNTLSQKMNHSLEEFRFDDACSALYSFIYDSFCGYYIELSKVVLYSDDENEKKIRSNNLKFCFREIVKLLHPVSPYITEEIWKFLKNKDEDLLISQEYPETNKKLEFQEEQELMNEFIKAIGLIRNLRASVNMKPKEEITVHFHSDDDRIMNFFSNNKESFHALAKVKNIVISKKGTATPAKSIMGALNFTEIYIPLEGVIDLSEQIKRLQKDIDKNEKEFQKLEKKLSNQKFVDNAPKDVIDKVKEEHKGFKDKIDSLKNTLSSFQ